MNQLVYKINEYVMCRYDVCKIIDIRDMSFAGIGERKYYIVAPLNEESSRIYIPADSDDIDSAMRRMLTIDEINEIIEQSRNLELAWIDESKERVSRFDKILQNGDTAEIIWLIKALKEQKKQVESEGKKLCAGDSRVLETARKIISEEFAFVLGLEKNEVEPYIADRTEKVNE